MKTNFKLGTALRWTSTLLICALLANQRTLEQESNGVGTIGSTLPVKVSDLGSKNPRQTNPYFFLNADTIDTSLSAQCVRPALPTDTPERLPAKTSTFASTDLHDTKRICQHIHLDGSAGLHKTALPFFAKPLRTVSA